LTAWLLYRIARRWRGDVWGNVVGVVAIAVYASFLPAVVAEGRVMVEPWLNLASVLGVWLWLSADGSQRRLVAAGAAFGAAVLLKLTAGLWLIGLVVTAAVVGSRRRLTGLRPLFLAALGTVAVGLLPFVVAAGPRAVWSQVVLTQVERPDSTGLPGNVNGFAERATKLFALGPLGSHDVGTAGAVLLMLAVLACALVALRYRDPLAIVAATVLVSGTGVYLVGPSFYDQYGVVLLPSVALVTADAAVWATAVLRRQPRRLAVLAGAALLLAGWQFEVSARSLTHARGATARGEIAAALAAHPGCVYADPPFLAIQVDRLSDDVEKPLVDPFGELLVRAREDGAAGPALDWLHHPAAQTRLERALDDCPVVVLDGEPEGQFTWSSATASAFRARHQLVATESDITVWTRTP
jgi:4-amino-4-deoxy-L-arabinose transferase-like glycosyltransferase